jgi:hypothetical protein
LRASLTVFRQDNIAEPLFHDGYSVSGGVYGLHTGRQMEERRVFGYFNIDICTIHIHFATSYSSSIKIQEPLFRYFKSQELKSFKTEELAS